MRGLERRPVEVRPEHGCEDELGVGRLPQQEIRQALLARGADDEVRIGNADRVEPRGQRGLVHVVGRQPPGGNVGARVSRQLAAISCREP